MGIGSESLHGNRKKTSELNGEWECWYETEWEFGPHFRSPTVCCFVAVSSPVVWEGSDKKKFRALSSRLSQHLEDSYAQYLASLQSDRSARKSRVQQTEHNFDVSTKHFLSTSCLV